MNQQDREKELAKRIAAGDKEAEAELLQTYSVDKVSMMVLARFRRHSWRVSPIDLQDITANIQIAFLEGLQSGRYNPESGRVAGYMFGIVNKTVAKWIDREPPPPEKPSEPPSPGEPNQDETDLMRRIRECLKKLKPKYQAIFLLAEEEYSIKEIAEVLGTKPQRVREWVHRGRKLLEKCLAKKT